MSQKPEVVRPVKLPILRNPFNRSAIVGFDRDYLIDETGNRFPVINSIPRFIESNYAGSFGFQWNLFRRTQIDKFNGTSISKTRFFKDTGWSEEDLKGKRILEVGCGAGRFTEIMLEVGAEVHSVDMSNAVDANFSNNGPNSGLNLYQANLYALPFENECFDKIFCFGVLQHTPNPREAFNSMIPFLKRGGEIAVDVYPLTWRTYLWPKYWIRPITKRIDRELLLILIQKIIPVWLPISTILQKIPVAGFYLSQLIPHANYTKRFPELSRAQTIEWAILDTFDMLSPAFDKPQRMEDLAKWFKEEDLDILNCGRGDNGLVAVGRKR